MKSILRYIYSSVVETTKKLHIAVRTKRCLGFCCGLFLLSSWAMPLVAQKRIQPRLDIGVIGGAVLSQMTFDPSITQDMAQGYSAGVSFRYIEEQLFGLQIDALLSRRGWRDRYNEFPEYFYQRNLTYLEIPFLSHIYFPMGQRNEISVNLGPKLGVMLGESSDSNLPSDFDNIYTGTTVHHSMDVSKRFDYGIQAGLGYEFRFNPEWSMQLSGSYYFGLGNIFPDTKSDTFETSSNQHIMITLTLYRRMLLKNKR